MGKRQHLSPSSFPSQRKTSELLLLPTDTYHREKDAGEKSFYTVSYLSTGVCRALTTRVPHPGLQGGPSTHFS